MEVLLIIHYYIDFFYLLIFIYNLFTCRYPRIAKFYSETNYSGILDIQTLVKINNGGSNFVETDDWAQTTVD